MSDQAEVILPKGVDTNLGLFFASRKEAIITICDHVDVAITPYDPKFGPLLRYMKLGAEAPEIFSEGEKLTPFRSKVLTNSKPMEGTSGVILLNTGSKPESSAHFFKIPEGKRISLDHDGVCFSFIYYQEMPDDLKKIVAEETEILTKSLQRIHESFGNGNTWQHMMLQAAEAVYPSRLIDDNAPSQVPTTPPGPYSGS